MKYVLILLVILTASCQSVYFPRNECEGFAGNRYEPMDDIFCNMYPERSCDRVLYVGSRGNYIVKVGRAKSETISPIQCDDQTGLVLQATYDYRTGDIYNHEIGAYVRQFGELWFQGEWYKKV